jgi:hypothetical protein
MGSNVPPVQDFRILRQQGFDIGHCPSCAVPGYLIVSPAVPARSWAELPAPASRELGQVLEHASVAIRLTIAPLKLHCARFEAAGGPLGFHLFPRTVQATRDFLKAFPGRRDQLFRPLFLHWARSHYRAPLPDVWRIAAPVIPALRDAFLMAARARSPLS